MKNDLIFKIVSIFLFACLSQLVFGQDIIHLRNSKKIEAKILEIEESSISYKMFNYQDGPMFKLSSDSIYKIVFENGYEYAFVEEKPSHNLPADAPLKDLVADGNNVYIIMEDPTNSFDEKDAFIREYIPEYTKWNLVEIPEEADFILFIEVHKIERSTRMHSATPYIRRPDGTEMWKGKTYRQAPAAANGFMAVRGVSRDIVKKGLMGDLQKSL